MTPRLGAPSSARFIATKVGHFRGEITAGIKKKSQGWDSVKREIEVSENRIGNKDIQPEEVRR
jgi:hypothetical protein